MAMAELTRHLLLLIFLIISVLSQSQQENNSYVVWAYRPWGEKVTMYGGFWYGYTFASEDLRPTNWTKRTSDDEQPDNYMSMDMSDTNILYMIDNDNYGYWDILKINISCQDTIIDILGYTHTNEWCTEIIYSCTTSQTFCQESSSKTYFQAVAFDPDTRLFWWIGTPSSFTNNIGFYSFNVDTREDPQFHNWGTTTLKKQISQAQIYKGYLWIGEKLKDGLVRYNLTNGDREIVISLDDYDIGATLTNFGAFAFDTSTDLIYFTIYDNYKTTPTKMYSRSWNIISPTITPYTQYDLGLFIPSYFSKHTKFKSGSF